MSTRSTTPPGEDRLKALIVEAYEALPAPDPWRLKELEERLSRRLARPRSGKQPSNWVWWLVGALLAASAAAWWTYETARDEAGTEQGVPVMGDESPLKQPSVNKRKDGEQTSRGQAAGDAQQGQGPVIFRRETY